MKAFDALRIISDAPVSACACPTCKRMCHHRPCWGTPDEIDRLLDGGHAESLMADYWDADGSIQPEDGAYRIDVIAPAMVGYGGTDAPWWPHGRCTMLDSNDLCTLHNAGLKPVEGRTANHTDSSLPVHKAVAVLWNTARGREVAARWRMLTGNDVRP